MGRRLLVFGLILLAGFVGAAECLPEVESNDSPELADGLGTLPGAGCRVGALDWAGDVDYYWFEVDSTCTATLEIGSSGALLCSVYDPRGRRIQEIGHAAGGEASRLGLQVSPGAYAVRVESAYGAVGWYEISVSSSTAVAASNCIEEVEANDRFVDADALRPRADVSCRSGAISPAEDVDVYWFEIGTSATVVLETVTSGDTVLVLYDGAGRASAEDDDGGAGSASRLSVSLTSGRYFAAVISYNRESRISHYEIHMSVEGTSSSGATDSGQTPWDAGNQTPSGDTPPWGWSIHGSGILFSAWGSIDKDCLTDYDFIHGLCDKKTYSFTVPSDGYLALALIDERGQWLRAEVLDAAGRHVVGREGTQSSIYSQWAWLTAGTYYVEVTPGKRLDRSAFELHVFYSRNEPAVGTLVQRYGPEERTL